MQAFIIPMPRSQVQPVTPSAKVKESFDPLSPRLANPWSHDRAAQSDEETLTLYWPATLITLHPSVPLTLYFILLTIELYSKMSQTTGKATQASKDRNPSLTIKDKKSTPVQDELKRHGSAFSKASNTKVTTASHIKGSTGYETPQDLRERCEVLKV